MKQEEVRPACPECAPDAGRRRFLTATGVAAAAVATGGMTAVTRALAAVDPIAKGTKVAPAETTVQRLYESLTAEQRTVAALPFNHPKATEIGANWHIVPKKIGELYNADQQRLIHEILRGVTSEEGYDRFVRQMRDDDGGLENFSCAIFGEPGKDRFEWVLTGRHLTIRADGNHIENAVFGGPIVYGHGAERPQDNLFYYQTKIANEVFQALDGKQREKALLPKAPAENSIRIKPTGLAGIPVAELSGDQRRHVEKVMTTLLSPYREADVQEAMRSLKGNGGLEHVHLSFYRNDDLNNDQEWDIWRLEGPTLVWHFRGAPHVHTWVNWKTKA